jgi:hypothetical protein
VQPTSALFLGDAVVTKRSSTLGSEPILIASPGARLKRIARPNPRGILHRGHTAKFAFSVGRTRIRASS